jgi:hypothetical protein
MSGAGGELVRAIELDQLAVRRPAAAAVTAHSDSRTCPNFRDAAD